MSLVLVEPEGLTTSGTPAPRRSPGARRWALAAVVGVLAATTLAIGERGGIELATGSDRRLIEAHLAAWYGGDFDAANALRAPERLRTGPSEERAREEVAYQAAMEAGTDLLDCERLPPSTLRCDVAYSNALNDAADLPPAIVSQQFGIEDGGILFVAGPYLEDEALTASFRRFAETGFAVEYSDACFEEPDYQTVACAELKLAHLGEWVAWHRIEEG